MHAFALFRRFLLPMACLLFVVQAHAGLVLHYTFDETSGTTAADSSGSGNTGTLTNMTGTEWTTGRIGGALNFDGTNDYVHAIGYKGVTGTGARSVALWFKTTTTERSAPIVWFGRDGWGTLFYLYLSDSSSSSDYHAIASYGGGSGNFTDKRGDWANGDWHHLAVTIPDNGTPQDAVLYVDGVGRTGWGSNTLLNTWSQDDVFLGKAGVYESYWSGQLDDVRFYDSALSASEVSTLAAMGGAGATPEPAETFAILGLLVAVALGFREWRLHRSAKAA